MPEIQLHMAKDSTRASAHQTSNFIKNKHCTVLENIEMITGDDLKKKNPEIELQQNANTNWHAYQNWNKNKETYAIRTHRTTHKRIRNHKQKRHNTATMFRTTARFFHTRVTVCVIAIAHCRNRAIMTGHQSRDNDLPSATR